MAMRVPALDRTNIDTRERNTEMKTATDQADGEEDDGDRLQTAFNQNTRELPDVSSKQQPIKVK